MNRLSVCVYYLFFSVLPKHVYDVLWGTDNYRIPRDQIPMKLCKGFVYNSVNLNEVFSGSTKWVMRG